EKGYCPHNQGERTRCHGPLRDSSKCASALKSTGISQPSSDRYIQGALWHISEWYVPNGRTRSVFPAFAFRQVEIVPAGMRVRGKLERRGVIERASCNRSVIYGLGGRLTVNRCCCSRKRSRASAFSRSSCSLVVRA